MSDQMSTDALGEIWADDLFGRRAEAELLGGYVESVFLSPNLRGDANAYTLAVDAGYGVGKTFFLKRLAKTLALKHPVAFVDAWADDLADEPMTALAATLKEALSPLFSEKRVRDKWQTFLKTSGKVAKVAGIGLLKRGIGFLITQGATEAVSQVLSESGKELTESATEAMKGAGDGVVDDAASTLGFSSDKLMEVRINEFDAGRASIDEMKRSLAAVVGSLPVKGLKPPIVIIIDELDRCRPTYAIKLLEEIKHLFDVPGLVFVFGLYGDQLAHSISGAYGAGFDGKAYLRRFLHRRYRLADPDLEPLCAALLHATVIGADQLKYPSVTTDGQRVQELTLARILTDYMTAYGMGARDAFEVVDMLQTCCVLARPYRLYLPYLLPLVMGHVGGNQPGGVPPIQRLPWWSFWFHEGAAFTRGIDALFAEFDQAAKLNRRNLIQALNDNPSYALTAAYESIHEQHAGPNELSKLSAYSALLNTVSRFRDPLVESVEENDPSEASS